LSLIAASIAVVAPWSVSACMVAPFENVFHARKPIHTPFGFQAFLVVVPKIDERRRSRGEVLVTIAEGQSAAFGLTKVVVRRAISSSWGSWGVTGGWAYVVGIISAERDGRLFITPLENSDTENFISTP
jgi:hypothetical protein